MPRASTSTRATRPQFYLRQIVGALSPSNFVLTNPELLRHTLEENGANLVRGMKMLAEDIEAGKGELQRAPDGSVELRGRPQHGDDARQGRLPQRLWS